MIDNDIPSFSIIFHFHLGGHGVSGKPWPGRWPWSCGMRRPSPTARRCRSGRPTGLPHNPGMKRWCRSWAPSRTPSLGGLKMLWNVKNSQEFTTIHEFAPFSPNSFSYRGSYFKEDPRGMVLELLQNAKAAANPPNFATVTRDALPRHGAPGVLYTVSAARQIALRVSAAAEYLHSKGLMHGETWQVRSTVA